MNLILFESGERIQNIPPHDERATHLLKVLHKGVGDEFEAGVLGGKLGRARIVELPPEGGLRVELALDRESAPLWPLRVAVGFPRPIQLRRLLRDLSSMGVAAIDLVGTELGEKSYRDTKLLSDGGARSALVEGAVQARSTLLPQLAAYRDLRAWLAAAPWRTEGDRAAWNLVAPDNVRPAAAFPRLGLDPAAATVLAIGSERGWSESERAELEAAGFVRASMGSRALRTETACVVAAALALEQIGALG